MGTTVLERPAPPARREEAAAPAPPSPAAVEKKLFTIRYRADERSHLALRDPARCATCARPCLWFCPAAVYRWENGQMHLAYENCLECGTCRIACPHNNIVWTYPTGGCGIAYKRGEPSSGSRPCLGDAAGCTRPGRRML